MIPKATLHHYISMVMRDKAVVLHGPQGCGKTYLAKSIAEFIKVLLSLTSIILHSEDRGIVCVECKIHKFLFSHA